jgi:hypothetical protein
MSPFRSIRPLAVCLALMGAWAAHATEPALIETPSDCPDADKRAEPPKPDASAPADARDKEQKRRPGFRIKLPAESEL